MYELFILGELLDKPAYGYMLHQIITAVIGPVRQLSWGALYPLLQRLEREGLIAQQASELRGGRERKLYRITAAGAQRFQTLMAQPGAYDVDYPDLFTFKLDNFHHIKAEERLAIVQHYRGYINHIRNELLSSQQKVSGDTHIPDAERAFILRALEHRLHLNEADLQWLDTEIARLANDWVRQLQAQSNENYKS